ncbi:MAG TPA: hypothetical protein VFI31_24710 [Pirellulales bacterium]|nr:hypothetical protein [Pirellulales bacterium]
MNIATLRILRKIIHQISAQRWLGQSRASWRDLARMLHRGDAPVGQPPGHRWPAARFGSCFIHAGQLLPQPPFLRLGLVDYFPRAAIRGLLMVAALSVSAALADPGPAPCPGCGCSRVKKICRLVCEIKEDIEYEYDLDYDDYCLPAKSKIRGKKWVDDCKSLFHCRKVLIWQPRCECKIHTRKTLVKIPVIKKVPSYNCVVECVCCRCGKSHVDAVATAQARRQGIMPNSLDTPIVLDTGEAVVEFANDAGSDNELK